MEDRSEVGADGDQPGPGRRNRSRFRDFEAEIGRLGEPGPGGREIRRRRRDRPTRHAVKFRNFAPVPNRSRTFS
ncbi:MAG TPA: hypothetical protein DCG14_08720 [Phycisphaerales bacterium]|nr:hypothetical protein [Phycisphaerales bacterium]